MSRVVVVGAGVVGLSCAVRLLEAGRRVDVVARDLPLETTSAVAAAFWYPYRAAPHDKVAAWGSRTRAVLEEIAAGADGERAGVVLRDGTEVLPRVSPDPWWASAVPDLRRVEPPRGYADAWSFVSPVVEMPRYLPWLAARVESLGGTITRMNLSALPPGGDVVVNATGIGSRHLASDPEVHPVRGQVVVVEQVGLERWWVADDGPLPTYVVPRSRDIVLGGTADEGDWSRTPVEETAASILRRTAELEPALAGARVLRHKVGLRPARPSVRVERRGRVVHCYGHGGAGVTVSWGCADEVASLAAEVLDD
ncbi:MAG: amino acid oxidase [Nocardioides sp.]|nr:amino acid oxidase [Nocardioides sp.]